MTRGPTRAEGEVLVALSCGSMVSTLASDFGRRQAYAIAYRVGWLTVAESVYCDARSLESIRKPCCP